MTLELLPFSSLSTHKQSYKVQMLQMNHGQDVVIIMLIFSRASCET